jgi:hypothetical protein
MSTSHTTLLIYMPIYNAENRIKRTLQFLTIALKNYSTKQVRVHIQDNYSSDKTVEIVKEFVNHSDGQITLDINKENIGGMLNIFHGLIIDVGQKFTWMIGDDDLIAPNSLDIFFTLQKEIKNKSINIKFIHVNTLNVSNEIFKNDQIFNLLKEKKVNGWIMNQKFTQPTVTEFKQVIDPKVDGAILGGIFGCIFDSQYVRKTAEIVGYDHVPNSEYLYKSFNCKDWYPHTYIFSKTFSANDLALVIPNIFVINTNQHQSYLEHRAPIFGCGSIDSLFEFLDNGVITLDEFDIYLKSLFMAQKHLIGHVIQNRIELYSERKREVLLKIYAWFIANHVK